MSNPLCDDRLAILRVSRANLSCWKGKRRQKWKRFILSRIRVYMTKNNGFWIGWLDLLTPSFTINCNSSQSMTVIRLAPFLTGLRVSLLLLWLTWFWFKIQSLLRITAEWITTQSVQSQNYFTTSGLPPISSSWRQALWDSRPAILFFNWTLAVIVLM
jgi:hypothetical protein